jgi:glutathione S-transferase
MDPTPIQLFGAPVGLYTGKVRCFLRKQGIAYVEKLPTDRTFRKVVLPAIGRFMNPVILTADGVVVQDTADILDFLASTGRAKTEFRARSPKQKLVALALDLFGGEGLVRPAMHYRWNFLAENESFLRHEFGLAYRAIGMDAATQGQQLDAFLGYLQGHLPNLGITPETVPAIEEAYRDLLGALDAHFRVHPYALGGRPTLADYGLIAPLWAHLGRDPYPSMQMKREAPSVFRWTERMNACDDDMPEFPGYAADLLPNDEVPETVMPVLALMARDFLPELRASVAATDAWLAEHPDLAAGTPCTASPSDRGFARASFALRGATVTATMPVYTLCMLQRVTDAFAALDADAKGEVERLFDRAGLASLLTLSAARRVERRSHLEVWGDVVRSEAHPSEAPGN